MEKKVRRRGLLPPYNPLQIISWAATIFNIIIVSLIYLPFTKELVYAILFYSVQSLAIFFAFIICITDPSDPISTGKEYEPESSISATCNLCRSPVRIDSKHCGQCNRCVHGFDHHCKWLNTCIGEYNYKLFIILVVIVLLLMLIFASYSIHMIFIFSDKSLISFLVISSILITESVVVTIVDINLIGLHIYLKTKGLSTYEYIMEKKRKKIQGQGSLRKIGVIYENKSENDINRTIPALFSGDPNKSLEI